MDLWGSHKGILILCFLLLKVEQRSLNIAASTYGWGYFENAPHVDTNNILIRITKDALSKDLDRCGGGLNSVPLSVSRIGF